MDRGLWISALAGFLAPVALLSPLNTADAWLAAWQHPIAKPAPVEPPAVRPQVERRAASRHREAKTRIAVRAPKAPAAPKPIDPKEQLARTIDPAKRPDWYLIDPTLKRGDVLFLADRVVVFRGDRIGKLADYVPVSRTRMLSRKEKRLIEKLAGRPAAPVVAASPAARSSRVAAAPGGPVAAN